MPTLREHAAARRAQTELSRIDAETFQQALARTYECVVNNGPSASDWQNMTHTEMVAVVLDRLEAYGRLTEDEYWRFCLLARDLKQALATCAIDATPLDKNV